MQENSLTGFVPGSLLKPLPEAHQNVINTEADNGQNISSMKCTIYSNLGKSRLKSDIFVWLFQMSYSHFWDKYTYCVPESPQIYYQQSDCHLSIIGLFSPLFQVLLLDDVIPLQIVLTLPLYAVLFPRR